MKKVLLTKAGLHAWGTFLVAVLCLLLRTPIQAQTVQSAQYKFPTTTGQQVIVRESDAGVPVISYRREGPLALDIGAHFVYGDLYSGTARDFLITDTLNMAGDYIRYTVNDMRVVGDMCYFCGNRECTYGEPDPWTGGLVIDSIGILGRFRLDPSGFGASLKFELKHMHGTKSLNRMATYTYYQDTVLAMIGVVDMPSSQSCVAVARERGSGSWGYTVLYPEVSDTMDIFTDIAVDTGMTTIASYRKNDAGKNHFCLRSSRNFMIQFDSYTDFDSLFLYRMDLLATNDSCINIVRPNNTDVRLSAVPWDKKVYAAFMCTSGACPTNRFRTAMCEVQTTDMILNNTQIVQRLYTKPDVLADTRFLFKTHGDTNTASVALLHSTNDYYNTVVEYPNASITSYNNADVPKVLVQLLENNKVYSVSAYKGKDIRFGGEWSTSSSVITYLQELLPTVYNNSMCMKNGDSDILPIRCSQKPIRRKHALMWMYYPLEILKWDVKPTVSSAVETEQNCIYY